MLQNVVRALFSYACFALLPLCSAVNMPTVPSHLKMQDTMVSAVPLIPKAHKHNSHRTLNIYLTGVRLNVTSRRPDIETEEFKIKFHVINPKGKRHSSKEIYIKIGDADNSWTLDSVKNPIIEIENAPFGNYTVCYEITDTMGSLLSIIATLATTNTGDSTRGLALCAVSCNEANVGQIIPAGYVEVSRKHK